MDRKFKPYLKLRSKVMGSNSKRAELSTASRVRRIITGSVLIGITMSAAGLVGYLALLPLVAIYPILTGLFGKDPIDGFVASWQGGFEGQCFRPSTRIGLLLMGAMAVAFIMFSPDTIAIRALLAFTSVYFVMAGLFGEDLISLAVGYMLKKQVVKRAVLRTSKISKGIHFRKAVV
jgi:hypothetical protein